MENGQIWPYIHGIIVGWFLTECWRNYKEKIKYSRELELSHPQTKQEKDRDKEDMKSLFFLSLLRLTQVLVLLWVAGYFIN